MTVWLRLSFLLAALVFCSAFRFGCFMFCSDLTSLQRDYNDQRDQCRENAQLKVDTGTAGNSAGEKQLISLFSECMAKKGWVVPEGSEGKEKSGTMPGFPPVQTAPAAKTGNMAGVAAAPVVTAPNPSLSADQTAYLKRSSECAFARHSADVSSNAAARAKACDIECAQRLKSMPDAPRPAACPAETNTKITPNMVKRGKNE